jgi:hypothetical protein
VASGRQTSVRDLEVRPWCSSILRVEWRQTARPRPQTWLDSRWALVLMKCDLTGRGLAREGDAGVA